MGELGEVELADLFAVPRPSCGGTHRRVFRIVGEHWSGKQCGGQRKPS
jgi:hypothetical protein